MPFHRELFKDLPPAEDIRKSYEHARRTHKDADGYYALVQDIAAKYGAKAYELAEAVFREMELEYDPSDLRTPGKIRRAGYAFDGGNIYDIEVKPFEPAMIKGVVRCYRNVFRHVSTAALIDEPYFETGSWPAQTAAARAC